MSAGAFGAANGTASSAPPPRLGWEPHRARLAELRARWGEIDAPQGAVGCYHAVFVGPSWLRALGPLGVALGGLRGWWGKELSPDGEASNLVTRGGALARVLPMRVAHEPSIADGRPALALTYGPDAPLPWRWVRDELRALDDRRLLAVTFVDHPRIGRLRTRPWPGLPFLLVRDDYVTAGP